MSDKENKDLEKEQSQQPEQSDEAGQAEQAELNEHSHEHQQHEEAVEVTPATPDFMEDASHGDPANEAVVAANGSGGGKVWPIISLVLAAALVAALVIPMFGGSKDEVLATINGVKIMKSELYDKMLLNGGKDTLKGLIQKELVNQEATKQNITIDQAEIDEQLNPYIESMGSKEAVIEALSSYGMTMDDLTDDITMGLKLNKLLEKQITITDEQIKQTFEQYQESFNTPEQIRTSVILVATEEEANDIIKQLKEGADFAELAKSKSLDTLTSGNGGDTDFFGRGEKEEAIEYTAFNLKKDEISEPVQTSEGYNIIKLTDRKEAHIATLEESTEEIREGLISQQASQMAESYLAELESKGHVTNKLAEGEATATNTVTE